LAAAEPCSCFPIQSIQGQSDSCTGPQAEPGQQEHDRVITLPLCRLAVTAVHQTLDVLGCHQLRQTGEAPMRHGGHRLGHVGGDRPSLEQQAAKAPQGRGLYLGIGQAILAVLPYHAVGDIWGA
jgi:hypothetical protein